MKTVLTNLTEGRVLSAVLFLSGLGAGIIMLNFIVIRIVGFPLSGWFPLGLRCISVIGGLVLSASLGILVRRYVMPTPHRFTIAILLIVMSLGFLGYAISCEEGDWHQSGQIMVSCIIMGYLLMPILSSSSQKTNAASIELVLISSGFACLFAVTGLLTEFEAVRVVPAIGCVYVMLKMAFSDGILRCMRPRWIRAIVVCLCLGSFYLSLRFLYVGYYQLGQVLNLLVQPMMVWLVYQAIRWIRMTDKKNNETEANVE